MRSAGARAEAPVAGAATPTLTARLAARAAQVRLADLSDDVVARAKASLADALALGLYGAREPCTRILRETLLEQGGLAQCSVFGLPQRLPALQAALINGTAIHAIDFDDTYGPGLAHLTAAVLPAALAVGEWRSASGAAVLVAYVAGYDAAARIACATDAAAMARRGFHPTGCFGTYGAAIAAGHVLGLDAAGLARALGLAATQAAGLMSNVGTMGKPLHAGKAAANGVLAAMLAAREFASSADPLGDASGLASYSGVLHRAALDDDAPPGQALLDTTLKPWPSCWLTHGAIDAALRLRDGGARPEAYAAVRVAVSPHAAAVCDRPAPVSGLDAKFSLQHVVALALAQGHLGIDDFDAIAAPPLDALRARVAVAADAALTDNQASVHVRRADGGEREIVVEHAPGSPARPLDAPAVAAKIASVLQACDLAHLDLPLCESVDKLDTARSVFELTNLCRGQHPGRQVE
jgi:2-methylcitrate dehydratase PrpD